MPSNCTLHEVAGQLNLAADCYLLALLVSQRSSAAACGLNRIRNHWLKSTHDLAGVDAWRDRVRRVGNSAAMHVGGGAGRCAANIANTSWLDAMLPLPLPPSPRRPKRTTRQPQRDAAERLTNEGRDLAAKGRLEEGAGRLRAAVAADHTFGEAHLWWGLCESHLGRRDSALERLATAERLFAEAARSLSGDTILERAATAAFEVARLVQFRPSNPSTCRVFDS